MLYKCIKNGKEEKTNEKERKRMKNKSISKKQNLLKMKRNNTSGITLIALVITIVILMY